MASYPTFLEPQTLAKLQGLKLRARHIVEGFVAGLHRSPYRGFSIEFAEHREYAPGDDLRHVDWKVFGRTDKFFLKQYEDETNLLCQLLVDASESMTYQSADAPLSKLEYARCLAAAWAHLVLGQQDAVGLTLFNEQPRAALPPSATPGQLARALEVLEAARPGGKTAAGPVFHELAERWTKRGVVVVLSDLFDAPAAILAGLKHFAHRRHDVLVFQLLDPAELDFPFDNPTLFRGLEEYPEVLANPRRLRRAYQREIQDHIQALRAGCQTLNLDYQLLRTDQNLGLALARYMRTRMERVK